MGEGKVLDMKNSVIDYYRPKYKWELLAWLSQNGIDMPTKTPKKQLYAIFYRLRRCYVRFGQRK